MMALKLLPILQVIIILFSPTYSYPTVYGTKRYGRLQRSNTPNWGNSGHMQPYQQIVRSQHYPMNYYDMYPYAQSYPDEYYYPHDGLSYPVYYPPARTSKYEVYQAVLPYYYDRPILRQNYYGYNDNTDPVEDLEEEMMQEAEREQREDAQPIGQEMYYENDSNNSEDNYNDVNAAFLQNLILSQMYKDSLNQQDSYDDDVYGKLDEYPTNNNKDYYKEDEDVMELKQLAKPVDPYKPKDLTSEERKQWFQRGSTKKQHNRNHNDYSSNNYQEDKRSLNLLNTLPISDRKVGLKSVTSTTAPSDSTIAPRRDNRGQKEEVLLRPATPVKHPFASPIMGIVNKKDRQWTPSVYDTIKQMLDMEKSLENAGELKPPMRKRIVSSDDSLAQQLTVLRKQ